jgi:hypothetical protein
VVNSISKINAPSKAAQGAVLMDKHCPGWAEHINPTKFTIESTLNCVLGQIYGNVEKGLTALGFGLENSRYILDRYGFAASTIGGLKKNIQQLDDEWLAEINRRIAKTACETVYYS